MMNDGSKQEKQKKAGNPLFIIIIFLALIGVLFYAPEYFKKHNPDISNLLGGNKSEEKEKETREEKAALSAYYQIGSHHDFEFNEIKISDYSLEDGILKMTISTEDTFDLSNSGYYIEFYRNRKTFIGRRSLQGKVTKSLPIEIDVSNLSIDTTVYFALSHISDAAIGGLDESANKGLSSITCNKGMNSYMYEFYDKKLNKVTYKYNYMTDDLDGYAGKLLEYQKIVNEYTSYKGVTASIADNSGTGTFIFIAEFDYSESSKFNKIKDRLLFTKGTLNNVVKFKVEAEGYDCN